MKNLENKIRKLVEAEKIDLSKVDIVRLVEAIKKELTLNLETAKG